VNAQEWFKTHKPEAALGVGGIVVAIVLAQRSKKGAGSGGASKATPTSYAVPATADTSATDAFSGLENQILGLQSAFVGSQAAKAAPTTPASTPAASGPFQGFGQQSIGGAMYDELGNVTNGMFNGYNVSGGEPVFYNVGGSLLTNLSPSAISGLPAGTDVLTVAQAGQQGQIASTAVSGQKIGA
jgi:hypothetical protein